MFKGHQYFKNYFIFLIFNIDYGIPELSFTLYTVIFFINKNTYTCLLLLYIP